MTWVWTISTKSIALVSEEETKQEWGALAKIAQIYTASVIHFYLEYHFYYDIYAGNNTKYFISASGRKIQRLLSMKILYHT